MEEEAKIEKKFMEEEENEEVNLTEEAKSTEEVVKNDDFVEKEVVKITEKVEEEEKPAEQRRKKIMVAIDETEFSHYALDWALETLRDSIIHSEFIILSVQPISDLKSVYATSFGPAPSELIAAMQETEKKFAQLILDKAEEICNQHGVTAEILTELGDPEHVICEQVEKLSIDMLIIGSHGRGAIQRAFLGSVSYYCAHHAKCPVLVVKKPH